jgi:lysozyme
MARVFAGLLLLPLAAFCAACDAGNGEASRRSAPSEPVGAESAAVQECPSQVVEGIDVFDGQGVIDWPAVADAGVAFAYIKATQGTYNAQSTFAENWAGAARAGVRRGAYHFFDPTEDGVAQARWFLSTVGTSPGNLPPMLDAECPDGDADCLGTGASGQAPGATVAAGLTAWLEAVRGAVSQDPVVYTFASYFRSLGIDAGALAAHPLFLADPTDAGCVGVPAPWPRVALWQYSWTGEIPGVRVPVDRDRFLGSLADLAAFGGAGTVAPEPSLPDAASCH